LYKCQDLKGEPMPILQFALGMSLTLCAIRKHSNTDKTFSEQTILRRKS
jgi:hypothetical protein